MTAIGHHDLGRRPVRWRAGRLAVAVTLGIAVAALAGAWTSRLVFGNGEPGPPVTRIVDAGPARVVVPAGWKPAALPRGLTGLGPEQLVALSDGSTTAVVTFGPAVERSLLPRDLRAGIRQSPPQPRAASLAGWRAWGYRSLDTTPGRLRIDVTVLPTTAGSLAVACAGPAESRARDCAASVKSVAVRGVTPLKPSRSVALAAELPVVFARIDRARVAGRVALGRARTPRAQAVAARRLARAYPAAAAGLRSAFGTAATPLIDGLQRSGRAYAALGSAASDGSRARFRAARGDVRVAESRLQRAVDSTRHAGARGTATAPTVRSVAPAEPERPLLAQALFVILLLVASAAGFLSIKSVAGRL